MKKENRVHTRNEVVVLLHAGGKLTKKAFLLSLDQEKNGPRSVKILWHSQRKEKGKIG